MPRLRVDGATGWCQGGSESRPGSPGEASVLILPLEVCAGESYEADIGNDINRACPLLVPFSVPMGTLCAANVSHVVGQRKSARGENHGRGKIAIQ